MLVKMLIIYNGNIKAGEQEGRHSPLPEQIIGEESRCPLICGCPPTIACFKPSATDWVAMSSEILVSHLPEMYPFILG